MAQVSLLTFLQQGLPAIPIVEGQSTGNTTSSAYESSDLDFPPDPWDNFDYDGMPQRYKDLLNNVRIQMPAPQDPPDPVTAEGIMTWRVAHFVAPLMNSALRETFTYLRAHNQMQGATELAFDGGEIAKKQKGFKADIAFYDPNVRAGTSLNRAPGDVKISWKWKYDFQFSDNFLKEKEFLQVLSQVNFYLHQNGARYGFVLTDRELVVFKRTNEERVLNLARPIPWTQQGTAAAPQMTVLFGLWYLGMVAAGSPGLAF